MKARLGSRALALATATALLGGFLALVPMADVASAAPLTFQVVNSTMNPDANPGDGVCDTTASSASTPCTLYAAIEEANANAGPDTITFGLASPYRITLGSTSLPTISSPVTIDGTSLAGFNPAGGVIPRIDGASNTTCCGGALYLEAGSDGSTIKGLEFVRIWDAAVGVNSSNNVISGNYFGVRGNGSATCTPNSSSCGNSIAVRLTSGTGNVVGGTTAADRNVIGNNSYGVYTQSPGSAATIAGNYIGVSTDGATPMPNLYGILADSSSTSGALTIGGTTAGARNIISGNSYVGIEIDGGTATIAGNYLGLNVAGTAAVADSSSAVTVNEPAHDVSVGGSTASHRNVITSTSGTLISMSSTTDTGFSVRGNYLGLNAAGTASVGTGCDGVYLSGTIGTDVRDNVISGDGTSGCTGITMTGCVTCSPQYGTDTTIAGNTIGLAANGSSSVSSHCDGIALSSVGDVEVSNNTVANLWCGASGIGVQGSQNVTVSANRVGTNTAGTAARPNGGPGVAIYSSTGTVVADNVVANSSGDGVYVSDGVETTITGNRIGTDAAGTAAMANAGNGVVLSNSDDSVVGGTAPGDGNLISGNGGTGIYLNSGTDDSAVLGNLVGVAADGTTAMANGDAGVIAYDGDRNRIGGTGSGEGNVIANSPGSTAGVAIYLSDRISVRGNTIYNSGGQAIDLGWDGTVAINDLDDPDSGPNRYQNYPVLTSAASNASGTQVNGALNSRPSTTYQIDFYTNTACDTSGHGEAKSFLGTTEVTTDPGGDASFTANLPVSALLGASVSATATDPAGRTSELSSCVSNSAIPTVSISPTSPSPSEGAGSQTFSVSLSAGSVQTTTVSWQTADGTASSADYAAQGPTVLTFTPGQTAKTISVPLTSDTLDEDDETFTVSLSSPQNALVAAGSGSATVTIVDDDALPTLSVADAPNVTETGGGTQTFTVSLSTASSKTVTVTAATDDGSATAPADYTATAPPLTFLPGETVKTVTVTYLDDVVDEADEVYSLRLHGPTNATLGDPAGDGTILDDDTDPTISITPTNPSVGEGIGSAGLNVSLSQASTKTVTVSWTTTAGTAAAGADYASQAPTVLTFNPGETTKPISVAITNDALDEPNETFVVGLSSPSESTIAVGSTTVTITDNDATPSLSVSNATNTTETPGGTTQTFTVSLSAPSGQTVQVAAATAGVTATEGADYTALAQQLIFLPGETSKSVNVAVLDDFDVEGNETYQLKLADPVNSTISVGTGQATIIDSDTYPTVSVAATNSPAAEGSPATFSVTLSGPYGAPVSVAYQTVNGTATAGSDYSAHAPTVLTFSPGQTTKTVTVSTTNDALDEDNETLDVVLSSPSRATLLTASATATITDDDATPTVSVTNPANRSEAGGNTQVTTVSLSAPAGRTVQVVAATAPSALADPATADADYTSAAALITFAPGETSKTFAVAILDDAYDEANLEPYEVRLFTPSNAVVGSGVATARISDNEATPTATIDDVSVLEGNSSTTDLVFTVTLSGASERFVRFRATTADGTAIGGSDYIAINKIVYVPLRTTTMTVTVRVKGNTIAEPDESFALDLEPVAFLTFADAQGTGTILDDD